MKYLESLIILTLVFLAFAAGRVYEDTHSQRVIAVLADKQQSCEEKLDMWRKYAVQKGMYKRYRKTVFTI